MCYPNPRGLTAALAVAALLVACVQQTPMPRSPTAPASALSPSLAPSPISGECEDQTQTLAVDPPTDPPRGLIDAADILTRALTWDEAWVTTGDGDRGTLPTIDDMPQLIVPEGTAMALHLTGDVAFVDYRAGVAIADRWPHRANEGNRMLRSGSTADAPFAVVCIPPPPLGDWVMNARLAYDLGRGYGDFYWHLVVQ